MKMKIYFLSFIALALVLTGCSNNLNSKNQETSNNTTSLTEIIAGNQSTETSKEEHYAYKEDTQEKMTQDFLLALLFPYIDQSITQYYGKHKQFYETKIIDIKRLRQDRQFSFKIKVKATTFEGPHNPPYGYETITMIYDESKVIVTKFEHSDEKID